MVKIAELIRVRTRLPAAAWVIAGVVTLASFVMTETPAVITEVIAAVHAVHGGAQVSQVLASVW